MRDAVGLLVMLFSLVATVSSYHNGGSGLEVDKIDEQQLINYTKAWANKQPVFPRKEQIRQYVIYKYLQMEEQRLQKLATLALHKYRRPGSRFWRSK